jgi:hypothetical protein
VSLLLVRLSRLVLMALLTLWGAIVPRVVMDLGNHPRAPCHLPGATPIRNVRSVNQVNGDAAATALTGLKTS